MEKIQSIKLTDFFLSGDVKPFLLGAFLSRIMTVKVADKTYFYCYTKFRSSKKIYRDDFNFSKFAPKLVDKLNRQSGFYNWSIHRVSQTSMELRFYIHINKDVNKVAFYNALLKKINSSDWIYDQNINDQKKAFIRGFMELRGSVDIRTPYISPDYFFENPMELKKAQILIDKMSIPMEYMNFNPRDLQPQFVSGENKRNPQLRINSLFYAKEIGFLNDYKAQVFNAAYGPKPRMQKGDIIYFSLDLPPNKMTFKANNLINRLNFYSNYIYDKNITSQRTIQELRKIQGLDDQKNTTNTARDQTIVRLFDEISPDKCASCGTEKTYTRSDSGRQYFEIHHVISFHNGPGLDNIANLVKLCPTCHRMMKRGSGQLDEQLNAIMKILDLHSEIREFTSAYLDIDDILPLARKIRDMLG